MIKLYSRFTSDAVVIPYAIGDLQSHEGDTWTRIRIRNFCFGMRTNHFAGL